MGVFHPVNSLVITSNWWLILLSKMWFFFFLIKSNIHKKIKFQECPMCAYFSISGCWVFKQFCNFSRDKSAKHIQGPCCHLAAETGSWFIPIRCCHNFEELYKSIKHLSDNDIDSKHRYLIWMFAMKGMLKLAKPNLSN